MLISVIRKIRVFPFTVLFLLILIGEVRSQSSFDTKGILIVDTVEFSGYVHLVGDGRYIFSSDSVFYENKEEFFLNGAALFIPPRYFSLMMTENCNLSNFRTKCSENFLSGSTKVGNFTYSVNYTLVVGLMSAADYNNAIQDYYPLYFKRNPVVWIVTCYK